MLFVELIIDASNARVFVVRHSSTESDLPARILRCWKTAREIQRRRRELRLVDAVDRVAISVGAEALYRSSQNPLDAVVACLGCKCREVSLQHCRRWNKLRSRAVRRTLQRGLMPAKEEELVVNNG